MSSARILIVDDDEPIRKTMQMALEAAGDRVETAADGPEALQKFGAGDRWDLVLLDERMPGMEGLEVLRRIRERDPAARVVMVTGYGTIDLAVHAMKGGAADFLRKPFTPEVLRGAVKAALARPRQVMKGEDLWLARLLPPAPSAPRPPVLYHVLNGYEFWPASLPTGEDSAAERRVRRAFEVKAPSGDIHPCTVELMPSVLERVRKETRRDHPPDDALWDTVCRSALSDHLWQYAQMPPAILSMKELSIEQLELVRRLAGPGARTLR